jgi:hypothetical protein
MLNYKVAIINNTVLINPELTKQEGFAGLFLKDYKDGLTSINNGNVELLTKEQAVKKFTAKINYIENELLEETDKEEIKYLTNTKTTFEDYLKQL